MTLKELLDEYENYLTEPVQAEQFPEKLYRGDRRDLAAITAAGGFFPKENGGDPLDIWALIHHCAENSYGGPFISTTEDEAIARTFGGNLYEIDAGMMVVAEDNWVKLADYAKRIEEAVDAEEDDTYNRNRASGYMKELLPALEYHAAQKEKLVINSIPIQNIHLHP